MTNRKYKILITGTGFFSTNLFYSYDKEKYEIWAATRRINHKFSIPLYEVKSYSYTELLNLIQQFKPDAIINAAALTNIEYCEKNEPEASSVNSKIPKDLAKICKQNNILLIQISTDQFYSVPAQKRDEKVNPIPLNIYGKTKLQGEESIIESLCDYIIIRTNFFGISLNGRSTFLDEVIKNLVLKKNTFGFQNYFFNPIYIPKLIQIIFHLIEIQFRGIINITSSNCISKYKFIELISKELKLDSGLIQKINIETLPYLVIRPKNLCLINNKLLTLMNLNEINLQDEIKLFARDFHLNKKFIFNKHVD